MSRAARLARVPEQPRAIELVYTAALIRIVRRAHAVIRRELFPVLDEIAGERQDALWGRVANKFRIVQDVTRSFFDEESVKPVVESTAVRIDKHNRRAMRESLGIDLSTETRLHPIRERFRSHNVQLITSIRTELLGQVQETLEESRGLRVDQIADRIEARFGVSESRAALIARDQTLKLNSQLTAARQQDAGVTEYVWTSVGDDRVRPGHRKLDGTRHRWGVPPVVDPSGRRAEPGQDFQCRCFPTPVLPGDEREETTRAPAASIPSVPEPRPTLSSPAARAQDLAGRFVDVDLGGEIPGDVATAPRPDMETPTLRQSNARVINDPIHGKVWEVDVKSLDDVPAMVWRKGSAERVADWYAKGNQEALRNPIKIGKTTTGTRGLEDGNHRLAVARLVGAERIRVRFLDLEDETPPPVKAVVKAAPPAPAIAATGAFTPPPPPTAPSAPPVAAAPKPAPAATVALERGKVESKERLSHDQSGANLAYVVHVRDEGGPSVKTIFKPSEMGFDYHDQEAGAYRVGRAMGFTDDEIMPTVVRTIDGAKGSMQKWATDAHDVASWNGQFDRASAEKMRVFDYVIGNVDRHSANVLRRGDKPVMIDHGLSFPVGEWRGHLSAPSANVHQHQGSLLPSSREFIAKADPEALAVAMRDSNISREAARNVLVRLQHVKDDPSFLEIAAVGADQERAMDAVYVMGEAAARKGESITDESVSKSTRAILRKVYGK